MAGLDLGFAFLAGLLTVLSPCVVPLLPVLFGTAASRHRFGPSALAVGIALAFTASGLLLATVGFAVGFDGDQLRAVSAALIVAVGLILLVPAAQHVFERLLAPVAGWGSRRMEAFNADGLAGQFALGGLLGLVWSPCVGPTLGAASLLASRGENLPAVAATMMVFGVGAALPLFVVSSITRAGFAATRRRLVTGGLWGRRLMGASLAIVGVLILTGGDRRLESWTLEHSPQAIVALTTRY